MEGPKSCKDDAGEDSDVMMVEKYYPIVFMVQVCVLLFCWQPKMLDILNMVDASHNRRSHLLGSHLEKYTSTHSTVDYYFVFVCISELFPSLCRGLQTKRGGRGMQPMQLRGRLARRAYIDKPGKDLAYIYRAGP
jgi:hypothetical protein